MEEKINQLFASMDVDCNGLLSKKEIIKAITLDPDIRSKIKGLGEDTTFLHPKTFGEDLHAMDTDHDGFVSSGEWHKWINFQLWCLAVDQDCASGATDDVETDDDVINLFQEQWRLRKLIEQADKAREAPNMVMYFKTLFRS